MISLPDLYYENNLWASVQLIAGLDEAGRGALAGPVCVGAVVLPQDDPLLVQKLGGVRDSKQLNPHKRTQLALHIKKAAFAWGVGFSSSIEIDELGIVPATRLAASRALEAMQIFPDFLLTDFRLELPELDVPQMALVKGDQLSLSISSASILAKTARDEVMFSMNEQFPIYLFGNHKGYGTFEHIQLLKKHGASPIHRRSFQINKYAFRQKNQKARK